MKSYFLKKDLVLKSGVKYPKGMMFGIKVEESKPTVAILFAKEGTEIKIRSISLHKYFKGFVKPATELADPDFDSCIVPSLTGENVEPDGWDEKGFPSILLALGYI